jgi:CBS domain-containing protein
MSRDLIFVKREATIREVAQTMLKQKIHRVPVLDDDQRLYGIISAVDFVQLFADQGD